MAILRSVDGRLYDVPDDQLGNYEVPAEKVGELMAEAGGEPGPEGGGGGVDPYGIHIHFGHRRRRRWRNCWRNCY